MAKPTQAETVYTKLGEAIVSNLVFVRNAFFGRSTSTKRVLATWKDEAAFKAQGKLDKWDYEKIVIILDINELNRTWSFDELLGTGHIFIVSKTTKDTSYAVNFEQWKAQVESEYNSGDKT